MAIIKVQKRNGAVVDFDIKKIQYAVAAAAESVGKRDKELSRTLAKEVFVQLEEAFADQVPTVENIQDLTEQMLVQYGYKEIAKSFILYREKRREAREEKNVVVEVDKTISE